MSLCQGAWETKVLSVALEIELFTRISKGASSVDKVSGESGIDVKILQMIGNACKGIGLLQGTGETLKNSPAADKYLVKGRDSYVGDFFILIGEEYYDVWRGLREVVVTGKPVRDDRMVRLSNPRYAEAYIKAMTGIYKEPARGLAKTLDLSGRKGLLEVGGGPGIYSIMIARKNPQIKATIYDSPFSCEFADRNIEAMKAKNVVTQGGDFEKGPLPKDHDVIMLTHVLQNLPPEKCESLLRKALEALPKGGLIVINEFLLNKDKTSPIFSALFALNSFMLSNGGSLYTQEEMMEWLNGVGFEGAKAIKISDFIISLTANKVR
jgi:ubiquinone/menaquinone biosynthesis C-methylase UbiE